jgi:uncharacterized RDD family membrane protein YckC
MGVVMNAIAQVSAAPTTGPKLDNRRVLAGIVDLLIVTAGALVVLVAGDSLSGDRQSALSVVILGWALYYYFALESGDGQTVGKKLMKLRVVRADGRPAGMREIAVRTVLRVVDGIGLYIVGLIVMLVTGEKRQRIGDLAAATIVVDASAPAAPVAAPADAEAIAEDETDHYAAPDAGEAEQAEAWDVEDEPMEAETWDVEDEHVAEPTQTITLPSRPQPPATLTDLVEEAEEAEQAAPEEPSVEVEEPTAAVEEPVVEIGEPEVEEPVVEVEEPVVEEPLPSAMSPSLEALAADVAAAQAADPDEAEAEDEAEPDEGPEDAGPVTVKSVETVSAMDLIMGAADDDAAKQDDDEGPASA